jgi:HK97 family phage prohead protease
MDSLLKFKSYGNSLKDVDVKKRIVTGYLSNFDNKDHDGDIIVKGAFSKSLNERKQDIYFLNQHNWKQPHGKFAVLKEDSKGLYFESEPLIDTSYSSDALKLYDAGIINEHSIGFQTIKSDKESQGRILKELKLYEGSNVTMGANSNTPFTGFKSLTLKEVNDKVQKIFKAVKNGTFTDETFLLLEFALKELQSEAYILGTKSQIIVEPLKDTQNIKFADAINEYLKTV